MAERKQVYDIPGERRTVTIRAIGTRLWEAVRVRAIEDRITVSDFVEQALRSALSGGKQR